jgi:hypothetical protein
MDNRGRIVANSSFNGAVDNSKAFGAVDSNAFGAAHFSVVTGDATRAYQAWSSSKNNWTPLLSGAIRTVVYSKNEDVVIIYDWLTSDKARKFEWNFHGVESFTSLGKSAVAHNGSNQACIDLYGVDGAWSFTDLFDVAPEAIDPKNIYPNQGHARFSAQSLTNKAVSITVIRAQCRPLDSFLVNFNQDQATVEINGNKILFNIKSTQIQKK